MTLAFVVVFSCAAGVLTLAPGRMEEPTRLSVAPSGNNIPRLEPIRVTYPARPNQQASAVLVSLQPPAPGQYSWIGDRTLQFQPDWPGLLRGQDYTIQVQAAPEAGVPTSYSQTFITEGRLTIDQVVPQDQDAEIPLDAQIMVQF